ncbi:GntR family transcriptional regulator [Methanolapillus ohkumae]|uniref:HTH-type transcriptional repressor YtrA n=1 Tax=Methanolapillus ohkumae TaxID=3028298 RepID=A0AA96V551_9EURY|nr:HTH-type transcriptional repressor YtrA [Methanosarcinaceae archaeon Am2]
MNIIISNIVKIPIYEQIKEQIKSAIYSGELREGDLLPSIRQLAKDLNVSVITTMRSYTDLEQEGFVANVQGKGCYVQPQNPELLREQKLLEIENNLIAAISTAKTIRITQNDLLEMLKLLSEEDHYE